MHGPQNTNNAIEIRDVTVGYEKGVPVLEGFSAEFSQGDLVLVRGNNGSGKSTLLEVCSGYLAPWTGSVKINGLDARSADARIRRRVCRTQLALYPNMTVRDHLFFASRCVGSGPETAFERVERYGLQRWLQHDAKSLSTGNSRKLWIIMCTLGVFDVVILDEPFNGLDDESTDALCQELRAWATDKSVLLISHIPPVGLTPERTFMLGQASKKTSNLESERV
jgi:ABC-type multidrug transport system ATPase subunit